MRSARDLRSQRHVNREDAALARHVANVDVTAVRSHGLPGWKQKATAAHEPGLSYERLCPRGTR
jgi:hypothetical protein